MLCHHLRRLPHTFQHREIVGRSSHLLGHAPVEPASRAGMFKPSCSPPFTLFLHLVSVYRPFQLYFIPKTIHNTSVLSSLVTAYFYLTGHSPVFIYNTTLYTSSYSLRSLSDPACLPCAASCVGGGWGPGG